MADLAYNYYDDVPEELLDGKIVLMAPSPNIRHHDVRNSITRIFERHLKGKPCRAFGDNVDVHLTEKDTVVPDAMIVCNKDIIKDRGIFGAPDLIVEVLSFSTAARDRNYKMNLYERCGVKEYWIADIGNRSIEVYILTGERYHLNNVYTAHPDWWLESMAEKDKAALVYEFKTHLFDDMIIDVREVFEDIDS
jgi:Uma2 family endonuclease